MYALTLHACRDLVERKSLFGCAEKKDGIFKVFSTKAFKYVFCLKKSLLLYDFNGHKKSGGNQVSHTLISTGNSVK